MYSKGYFTSASKAADYDRMNSASNDDPAAKTSTGVTNNDPKNASVAANPADTDMERSNDDPAAKTFSGFTANDPKNASEAADPASTDMERPNDDPTAKTSTGFTANDSENASVATDSADADKERLNAAAANKDANLCDTDHSNNGSDVSKDINNNNMCNNENMASSTYASVSSAMGGSTECKASGPQTRGNDLDEVDDLYGMKAKDKNGRKDDHVTDSPCRKEPVKKTQRATPNDHNDDQDDDLYGMKLSSEPKGDTFLSLSDSESSSGQDKFSTAEESDNDNPEEIVVEHIEWQHVWAIDPWDWRPVITPRTVSYTHLTLPTTPYV